VGSLRNFDDFGAVFPHFCPDKREIWNVNYCQKIIIITYFYPEIDRNFRGSGVTVTVTAEFVVHLL